MLRSPRPRLQHGRLHVTAFDLSRDCTVEGEMEDREEMNTPASFGSSLGVGIAMIAGGVAALALVLLFAPGITRWFEFVTAAVVFLVALGLVIRGVVIAVRKGGGRG